MNRRVQSNQQSQRNFVPNVSHELKTPLTSIQGIAQAFLDGAASTTGELKQAAGPIYTEAGHMYHMVRFAGCGYIVVLFLVKIPLAYPDEPVPTNRE